MERLTFAEIKNLYPDEWVLLADAERDGSIILTGKVLLHNPDKKEFAEAVAPLIRNLRNEGVYREFSHTYTGSKSLGRTLISFWQVK